MLRWLLCLRVYEVSFFFDFDLYTADFCSAEIDQLKKLQVAKPKENPLEEIPRPPKINSLQDAMGLTDDKKLYFHCRVFFFVLPFLYVNDRQSP